MLNVKHQIRLILIQNQLKMESKVSKLRENNFKDVERKAGFYRWWFKKDAACKLIEQMQEWLPDKDMFLRRDIDGETYVALYFGISKDMRGRIKWHASQKHTPSTVSKGFLSTLRQTLSALLTTRMSVSYNVVNTFIDDNCIWEWEYSDDPHKVELAELSRDDCYYPLNVKDNKTICKDAIDWLKQERARYRN